MSQVKKIAPLKKVIQKTLGKSKATKYLKGIDFVYSDTVAFSRSADLYQEALHKLLDGDTEAAINYIIFALDIERENKLILHLCKTMLFSLSKFLDQNNMDFYKQKYVNNLSEAKSRIRDKIRNLSDIIAQTNLTIKELEEELENRNPKFFSKNNPLLFNMFRKKKIIIEIDSLRTKTYECKNDIENLKNDLNRIDKMIKAEEYVKVLGLIIQVCVFPARFEWAVLK